MIRSYPLVQPALAFERIEVSDVVGHLGHERLTRRQAGGRQVG
jgi:hypothetical protein